VREQIDEAAGLLTQASNLPIDIDWPACVARPTAIADNA